MAKPGRTGPPSNTRSPVQAHTGEAALELHDTRRRRAGAASRCVQALTIVAWQRLALGAVSAESATVFGSGKRGALLARSRLKRQSSMSRRRTRRAREGGSVGRRTPDASAAAHGSADSPPSWFLLKPRPRFPPRRHASAEERHACAWARRPARGVTHPATQWPRQSLEPPAAAVAARSPRGRGSLRKPSGQR